MIFQHHTYRSHLDAQARKLPVATDGVRQWWDATLCGVMVAGVIAVMVML